MERDKEDERQMVGANGKVLPGVKQFRQLSLVSSWPLYVRPMNPQASFTLRVIIIFSRIFVMRAGRHPRLSNGFFFHITTTSTTRSCACLPAAARKGGVWGGGRVLNDRC